MSTTAKLPRVRKPQTDKIMGRASVPSDQYSVPAIIYPMPQFVPPAPVLVTPLAPIAEAKKAASTRGVADPVVVAALVVAFKEVADELGEKAGACDIVRAFVRKHPDAPRPAFLAAAVEVGINHHTANTQRGLVMAWRK